jgi:hypothetical protein
MNKWRKFSKKLYYCPVNITNQLSLWISHFVRNDNQTNLKTTKGAVILSFARNLIVLTGQ